MSASALPGETRTNNIWVEMNRNMSKSIPNLNDCGLKKVWQIFLIFGANIFDTMRHQMTVLVPTSPNAYFCTWKNPTRQNGIKMQYFVGFVSPGSAEADNGCSEILCQKCWCQKWLKSDNPSLRFNQKCPGFFFPDTVYILSKQQVQQHEPSVTASCFCVLLASTTTL